MDNICDCTPPVIETKTVSITYTVKVQIHECRLNDSVGYDYLKDAIKEWEFYTSTHDLEQDLCHVCQLKNGKWALLYM